MPRSPCPVLFGCPRLGLVLAALSISGCGISDYQSKMEAQRVRVQKFDDANNLLGDPIEIPKRPVRPGSTEMYPAWPFDVYLRLPKGYVLYSKPYFKDFACYRYYGENPNFNFFIAAAWQAEPKAKEGPGEYTAENFRRYTRLAIDDYYFSAAPVGSGYKFDPRFYEQKTRLFLPADKIQYNQVAEDKVTPQSENTAKIPYLLAVFNDNENRLQKQKVEFRAYYYEEAGRSGPPKQVCIIVQRPRTEGADPFENAFRAALGTLDVSSAAASKRTQYKQLVGS